MALPRSLFFMVLGMGATITASGQYLPWFGPPVQPWYGPPLMVPHYPMAPQSIPTQGMRSESGIEGNEYVVNLYLRGIAPESVEITPSAGGLSVRYGQQSGQGSPYGGGFSTSSMWMSQHISLPPGLDLRSMRRQHTPQGIQIRLPFGDRR